MIEIFKSRRYIGLGIALVLLCIVVMILEGLFTTKDEHTIPHEHVMEEPHAKPQSVNETKQPKTQVQPACWLKEEFHITIRCSKCDEAQIKDKRIACQKTGFAEEVRCRSGLRVFRSCVHESAVASFVQFELLMIVMSVVGWYACYRRESVLLRAAMEKINKQLSCGV